MMIRSIFLGLGTLALAACEPAPTGGSVGSGGARSQIVSQITPGQVSAGELRVFRSSSNFFGAFFLTEDGEGFGRAERTLAIEDAIVAARTLCLAQNPGKRCVLHATLEPSDPRGRDSLPANIATAVAAVQEQTVAEGFGAVFVTPLGHVGSSANVATQASATRLAREDCEANVSTEKANDTDLERDAFTRSGGYNCRLLSAYSSAGPIPSPQ